jgi:two-component system, LuxR family, sensor kinase FixL
VSAITVIWSMLIAMCLTLAAVNLPVSWSNRADRAGMAISLAGISTAAYASCELLMFHAQTPRAYAEVLRWAHVPIVLWATAVVAFVHFHLGTGRRWLAFGAIGLRLVALPFNFVAAQNLNYREVTELRSISILGEPVSIAVGVPNPWMAPAQLGLVLLIVFLGDATVTAWRRGHRGAAIRVGGATTFFLAASVAQALPVLWGLVEAPLMVSPFYLGVIAAMAHAMSRDLRRAQQLVIELRESEQQAALAADAAGLGIWSRDLATGTLWATENWRRLFGFLPGESLGMDRVMERIHADDRPSFHDQVAAAGVHRGEYALEYRLLLPDGRMRWIASQGRVEFDASHRPIRIRGASIDITARKQVEQEMLRLQHEIAHVGRVSVMGQLATTLAHEISQPLGAILRNAEAAALFIQDPTPDLAEIAATLEDIRKDDQRAGAIIDRMRTMLRRGQGEMLPLEVGQVLRDVAALLRADAAARHVNLVLEVPDALPAVRGDRVQLQQVLLNLVLNSMDALEGIAGDASRTVVVAAGRGAAQDVEISVADTGPGIPADSLERIFDPFFSTKSRGVGMGLSISRTLVEAQGGRLWAENSAAGGARLRMTLPIAPAA